MVAQNGCALQYAAECIKVDKDPVVLSARFGFILDAIAFTWHCPSWRFLDGAYWMVAFFPGGCS